MKRCSQACAHPSPLRGRGSLGSDILADRTSESREDFAGECLHVPVGALEDMSSIKRPGEYRLVEKCGRDRGSAIGIAAKGDLARFGVLTTPCAEAQRGAVRGAETCRKEPAVKGPSSA